MRRGERVTRDNKEKERGEQMRVRGRETREFQEATKDWHKRLQGRCPLSRIEKTGKGNARFERSSCVAFSFLPLFRRRANKPNEIVIRRICTYMRKIHFPNIDRVTFFVVCITDGTTDHSNIFAHRFFVNNAVFTAV